MAATATGRFSRVEQAAERSVSYGAEILPDPRWAETYRRTQPVFNRLYQALCDASTPWLPPRGRRSRDASQACRALPVATDLAITTHPVWNASDH
ncbi:hypothetical protein [Mesorhizobium sp.]|uniref:hypothetical protein n=1 Tax=Mesorhizobium sp. TaxID=1871066 RepID=UPI0025BA5689|nr:hypothetical protein [Mesorhizobium sp.]